jgi:endonuclease YncB( thermonuclease family)
MAALVKFLALALVISAGLNVYFYQNKLEEFRVSSVPDGDSVQLADGRRVRLLSIDAPERGRCMADEAREKLRSFVLRKIITLEDTVTDDYGRILANVSIGNILVNHALVEEGLAKYSHVRSSRSEALKAASDLARQEKRGIYSDACRTRAPSPDCLIKGNTRAGEKVYHLPTCDHYDLVIIDEAFGDQWFCTETEAQNAGFTRAAGCK